ncbi:MAG TPA: AbrB/MazE/SpoVT family DNA-binding domain-containing protein, partial [Polyangiaceae bacterium]
MRVTSKGQVTIPVHIREKLGLLPDTEVEFEIVGNAARIRKAGAAHQRGRRLVERMRGRATVTFS